MKVLWFEITIPKYYKCDKAPVNGWQDSLQEIVMKHREIDLTIAFEGQNGRNGQPFYSTVPLGQFSDAQEAVMLSQYALAVYNLKENPLSSDTAKAEEIQAFLDGILK